jgi:mycothiol synthase
MVSNLFRSADRVSPTDAAIEYRAAHNEEVKSAVQLILSTRRGAADEAQVVDFLRFAVQRGIDLNQMWVAARNGRLLWAILPIVSPGRTMLMFAPAVAPRPAQAGAAARLVNAIAEHYAAKQVDLSQVLVDPHDPAAQQVYLKSGFGRLAELVYLQKHVRPPTNDEPLPANFAWHGYSHETHELFARALASSYANSLDCPGLNGLRDIEDVIAGHKATGDFHPDLWHAITENDAPRGVLLLSAAPQTETIELVYLGLAPEARGRKLGDAMMRRAMADVLRVGRSRLALAVDALNAPALALYYRHGMQRISSRVALLRDLRRRASSPALESA